MLSPQLRKIRVVRTARNWLLLPQVVVHVSTAFAGQHSTHSSHLIFIMADTVLPPFRTACVMSACSITGSWSTPSA